MTGEELLKKLQALKPDKLKLPVEFDWMDSQDGSDWERTQDVDRFHVESDRIALS